MILTPIAFHRSIEDVFEERAVRRFTFHPSVPNVYDGLLFPAGSTVVEYPHDPHTVTNGTVPANTPLLGLVISGDFTMSQYGAKHDLIDATLAVPGRVHDVPCAAGEFKIERDFSPNSDVSKLNCVLSTDYTVTGFTLQSGTTINLALDHSNTSGTLAAPWKAPLADCGPGDFEYSLTLLECTLLHDTTINGYPLAADHKVSLGTGDNGALKLYGGTLSRTLKIFDVDVPAGSEISSSGDVPGADKLLAHNLDTYQTVDFLLPESAHFVIQGVDIRGRVRMSFGAHTFSVHDDPTADSDSPTGLHHDGIVGEHGTYNPETKKWCWEQACWQ